MTKNLNKNVINYVLEHPEEKYTVVLRQEKGLIK